MNNKTDSTLVGSLLFCLNNYRCGKLCCIEKKGGLTCLRKKKL